MILYFSNFIKNLVHIGHKAKNSLLLSSWFFYKLRKKIWIINIMKTIIFLKIIFKYLAYLINYKLPFWFINLELTKNFIFKKFAILSGEYYCTKVWVRGLLSNFKSIQKTLVKYYLKQYIIKKENKNILIKDWILTRFSWPRSLFISNILNNYIVCKEAGSVSIPIMGMVDTNIKSFLFHFPIPSNDDSINSVCYIMGILSKKILLSKYKKLILWYAFYKSKKEKNLNFLIENISKKQIKNFFGSKFSKIMVTSTLYKFKRNIKLLLKTRIGLVYNYNKVFNLSYYKFLKSSLRFYKRLINFYCYYKKTFFRFKLKLKKLNYKETIKNFVKLHKYGKKLKKTKKWKIKKRKYLFLKYGVLNNFFLRKIFSYTNNITDIYFENRFVDIVFLLNIFRWISMQKRYHLSKYFKRPILHYWLISNIVKFCIKKSRKKVRRFIQSKHYSEERENFNINLNYFIKGKKAVIKPVLSTLYYNWFFFLYNKKFF